MRAINKPEYKVKDVYKKCVDGISDRDLHSRLNNITAHIADAAELYDHKSKEKMWVDIPSNDCIDDQIIVGAVTKKELKELYSSQMVGSNKHARQIYDELKGAAPYGKCPFCGFGQATTIDHYLPKALFPCLSVLPINLVPACKDCNTGKSSTFGRVPEQQVLHPYYDHTELTSEQWLYAEVQEAYPASICFYVVPPAKWTKISQDRVMHHFRKFGLAKRFSIEAADELSGLCSPLASLFGSGGEDSVRKHLTARADSEFNLHKNSWKTAMFQALAQSEWFCTIGFDSK